MKITVVGQGYVGLPLAIAATQAGNIVFGLDNDSERVSTLNSGKTVIEDLTDSVIKKFVDSKQYFPTTDPSVISESEVILICVPTPLSSARQPDLTSLISATTSVGKKLKAGSLVIVESTVEPGTSRKIVLPILIKESGLSENEFYLAYSPERIDPTNKNWGIRNTPKLISGLTEDSANRASEFYGKFIDAIIVCSSLEIAETSKLLENSFRLVNISFINEISIFCQRIGIDVIEVISAAATKPYGFMPFYPGIGAGGHCIPVDPLYLANVAKAVGAPNKFIELADQINREMPGYFVGRAEEKLGSLKGKKVLVIGVAYKPNVADVRESPVAGLIAGLRQKNANVFWHDDLVKEWNGEKSVALTNEFDLAILATPHAYLELTNLGDVPILKTQGSN